MAWMFNGSQVEMTFQVLRNGFLKQARENVNRFGSSSALPPTATTLKGKKTDTRRYYLLVLHSFFNPPKKFNFSPILEMSREKNHMVCNWHPASPDHHGLLSSSFLFSGKVICVKKYAFNGFETMSPPLLIALYIFFENAIKRMKTHPCNCLITRWNGCVETKKSIFGLMSSFPLFQERKKYSKINEKAFLVSRRKTKTCYCFLIFVTTLMPIWNTKQCFFIQRPF